MKFYIRFNPRNFKFSLGLSRCFSNEDFRFKLNLDVACFSAGLKFARQR